MITVSCDRCGADVTDQQCVVLDIVLRDMAASSFLGLVLQGQPRQQRVGTVCLECTDLLVARAKDILRADDATVAT